jgi:hypothetical protein
MGGINAFVVKLRRGNEFKAKLQQGTLRADELLAVQLSIKSQINHLSDTILNFMGGIEALIPREIDIKLQQGPLIGQEFSDAIQLVWARINHKIDEKRAQLTFGLQPTSHFIEKGPASFDAYLEFLSKAREPTSTQANHPFFH